MKVLWICNVPTEDAAEYNNDQRKTSGGWLTGYANAIKNTNDMQIVYSYPVVGQKELKTFNVNGIKYYEFYAPPIMGIIKINANKNDNRERVAIRNIINIEKPDIVHIWGTEYYHSLMAIEENTIKAKTVCSIQGLTSQIARHYLDFIPYKLYHKITISSLIRGTLFRQKRKIEKQGAIEKKIIRFCGNVIGRTDWDEAVVTEISPKACYYKCNETLRGRFYKEEWSYEKCKPYTLFFSQGSSPLKGLNIALEALKILVNKRPNIVLHIAGTNFIQNDTLMDKLRISTYGIYIKRIIKQFGLEKNVKFLGPLNEDEMLNEYLKCNIFISCSSIENSSNSVCEAMLLGVPVVSSFVGGIPSLIDDKENGILYQGNSVIMLANNIEKMFEAKEKVAMLGEKARKKAIITHDPKNNNSRLIEIYKDILGEDDERNQYSYVNV